MAQVYFDFSRSLLESERPKDLAAAELQDYELVLEEESFPFEERAIAVHEKNRELLGTGIFNAWIEKSLGRLAVLMPGRYAKFETSSGFLTSIDHYAYRPPHAAPTAPAATPESGIAVAEPAEAAAPAEDESAPQETSVAEAEPPEAGPGLAEALENPEPAPSTPAAPADDAEVDDAGHD